MNSSGPTNSLKGELHSINCFANLMQAGHQNPEGLGGSASFRIPELLENGFIYYLADSLCIKSSQLEISTETP